MEQSFCAWIQGAEEVRVAKVLRSIIETLKAPPSRMQVDAVRDCIKQMVFRIDEGTINRLSFIRHGYAVDEKLLGSYEAQSLCSVVITALARLPKRPPVHYEDTVRTRINS